MVKHKKDTIYNYLSLSNEPDLLHKSKRFSLWNSFDFVCSFISYLMVKSGLKKSLPFKKVFDKNGHFCVTKVCVLWILGYVLWSFSFVLRKYTLNFLIILHFFLNDEYKLNQCPIILFPKEYFFTLFVQKNNFWTKWWNY